jgi:predicted phage terminase large subunit-like protein
VDPAITSKHTSDETGIMVGGIGLDGLIYVLNDLSGKYTPAQLGMVVATAAAKYKIRNVGYETNQGGDFVKHALETAASGLSYIGVHAHQGKAVRAEPVAAVTEQGRVKFMPGMEKLFHELTHWDPLDTAMPSPNRLDAFVILVTALMPHIKTLQRPSVSRLKVNENRRH